MVQVNVFVAPVLPKRGTWDPVQKLWRVRCGLIWGDRELVKRVVKG